MGGAMGGDVRARIEDEVRARIRDTGVDPARDARAVESLVGAAIDAWDERELLDGRAPVPDRDGLVRAVTDAVAGLGPLQPLLDDPTVEAICTV
ncbi:hypothetical protein QQX09_12165 [Demequina sp. SYSU T00192]|uniref:Pilus assembly protein CpaF n=1 Tax=Demequina litoralis TaxID=3051660 RepID=A0ABT8GBU5_9MICO|nr:hypothetical protein [Demequina sp. SYSU T00192]MDN4476612.1 hypothetical protein [Demequina sp. SYSU T00192]